MKSNPISRSAQVPALGRAMSDLLTDAGFELAAIVNVDTERPVIVGCTDHQRLGHRISPLSPIERAMLDEIFGDSKPQAIPLASLMTRDLGMLGARALPAISSLDRDHDSFVSRCMGHVFNWETKEAPIDRYLTAEEVEAISGQAVKLEDIDGLLIVVADALDAPAGREQEVCAKLAQVAAWSCFEGAAR